MCGSLAAGAFGVEDAKRAGRIYRVMRNTKSRKSPAITVLSDLSGLSESTIRRDLKLQYLHLDVDGLSASDSELERWLVERRTRCGGLTLESNHWLWSPGDR